MAQGRAGTLPSTSGNHLGTYSLATSLSDPSGFPLTTFWSLPPVSDPKTQFPYRLSAPILGTTRTWLTDRLSCPPRSFHDPARNVPPLKCLKLKLFQKTFPDGTMTSFSPEGSLFAALSRHPQPHDPKKCYHRASHFPLWHLEETEETLAGYLGLRPSWEGSGSAASPASV